MEVGMFLESLGRATIQSSLLFLFIWFVFRVAKTFPANHKAWIWRLAFLKPIAGLLPFAMIALPVLTAPAATVPVQSRIVVPNASTEQVRLTGPISDTSAAPEPIRQPIDPLILLWGMGVVGVGTWAIVSRLRAARIVKGALPIDDESVQNVFQDLMRKAGLNQSVELLRSGSVQSAMLFGGRRTSIVLPMSCLDTNETRLALAHEVAHIVRRDLAWLSITWIVRSLFFFNPIVWLAVRNSQLDHESATDRYACELAGVPVQTYAEMLLRATVVTRNPFVPGALSVGDSFRTIHRRLEAMKHFNSEPNRIRKVGMGVLALTTIGLLPIYHFAQGTPAVVPPPVLPASTSPNTPTPPAIAQVGDVSSPKISPPVVEPPTARALPGSSVPLAPLAATGTRAAVAPRLMPPAKAQKAKPIKKGKSLKLSAPRIAAGVTTPVPNLPASSDRLTMPVEGASLAPSVSVDQPAAASNIPPQVIGSTIPPSSESSENGFCTMENNRVSFKFENVDARKAFISFFKATGSSYLLDPSVKGNISISGQFVEPELAMRQILKAAGAECAREGATFIVFGGGK
jgi:beta-lactamase regulating signal transducer with metallopeptidase domain